MKGIPYPANVPRKWKITITRGYGLLFSNPDSRGEWVKIMPGDPIAHSSLQSRYAVHHYPSDQMLKRHGAKVDRGARVMREMVEFDIKNQEHLALLKSIRERTGNGSGKISETKLALNAFEILKNFWIDLDSFLYIRETIGYGQTSKFLDVQEFERVINIIREDILCDCHSSYISTNECGMVSKHNLSHHDNLRLAFHWYQDEPFVKICFDGEWRTAGGEKIDDEYHEAVHIKFIDVLRGNFDWYQTKCRKVVALSDFDYETSKRCLKTVVDEFLKQGRLVSNSNKRGLGYGQ